MALYLKLKGAKQGDIKGSITRKGREGWVEVLAASHQVVSPRDAASGQATGKRQHKPFSILKPVDSATPPLYSALVSNEMLTEWTLDCTARGLDGLEVLVYRVKLTNGAVAGVEFDSPGEGQPYAGKPVERASFVYQKIEWTWVPSSSTAIDGWAAA